MIVICKPLYSVLKLLHYEKENKERLHIYTDMVEDSKDLAHDSCADRPADGENFGSVGKCRTSETGKEGGSRR